MHLSKQVLEYIYFLWAEKKVKGKDIFGTVYFWFSFISAGVLFVQIKPVMTESALVLCRPGFHVVEHVGGWRFWIQDWILELCWNSCVNNNNSSCCSSWHSHNSYSCSCDSNRNHRKARKAFWLCTCCWLGCCDYLYVTEDSVLQQMAT